MLNRISMRAMGGFYMQEETTRQSYWKEVMMILMVLVSGFLLSFIGFGILWSGIAWHYQMLMFFPFLVLSWIFSRWRKGASDACVSLFLGAAPVGILMTQFRDTNGSHLMPILVVLTWILGILGGYFLGKISLDTQSKPTNDITSSEHER